MKRILAIIAVPVLVIGYLAAISVGAATLAGTLAPAFGWFPMAAVCIGAAIIVGALACEAMHRLIDFIGQSAPVENRRIAKP